jgi:hypothetical protein
VLHRLNSAVTSDVELYFKCSSTSLVRPSTFAEVAKAVMFLVDEESEVSGSELLMDGDEAHLRKLSEGIPPGKPGTPDEIAQNILYLASDDSRHLSGIELFVDGGRQNFRVDPFSRNESRKCRPKPEIECDPACLRTRNKSNFCWIQSLFDGSTRFLTDEFPTMLAEAAIELLAQGVPQFPARR